MSPPQLVRKLEYTQIMRDCKHPHDSLFDCDGDCEERVCEKRTYGHDLLPMNRNLAVSTHYIGRIIVLQGATILNFCDVFRIEGVAQNKNENFPKM